MIHGSSPGKKDSLQDLINLVFKAESASRTFAWQLANLELIGGYFSIAQARTPWRWMRSHGDTPNGFACRSTSGRPAIWAFHDRRLRVLRASYCSYASGL